MESISCPLTPKSHILISPREFTRMFEGFTSDTDRVVTYHFANMSENCSTSTAKSVTYLGALFGVVPANISILLIPVKNLNT